MVGSGSGFYRLFDHTADIGMDVGAPTLEALFETAALALFDIVTDPARVEPRDVLPVEAAGADHEETLVRWLSELLFLHDTRDLLFCGFRVLEISGTSVRGTATGEPFDPERHEVRTEIKAVTYHQVTVTRERDLWKARIVLDV